MSTISIALCTCNGERFLADQLQSYLTQTRRPDEIVVCDDASTDSTPSILAAFAASAPLPVRIFRNPTRLGVTRNFGEAISRCRSTYIALSDQDDVWLPEKLAQLAETLDRDPTCMGVFSDAQLVRNDLSPIGRKVWDAMGFSTDDRVRFAAGDAVPVLLRQGVATGATLMIRNSLQELALPLPADWMHDEWLALMCAATGGLTPVSLPLILYRQHSANVIGGIRKHLIAKIGAARDIDRNTYLDKEIQRFDQLNERLHKHLPPGAQWFALIQGKLAHLRRRRSWPQARFLRWPAVLHEWICGEYRTYSRNWHSIAFDLAAPSSRTARK